MGMEIGDAVDGDIPVPRELNPAQDYVSALGVAYGDQDDIRTYRDGNDLMFEDKNNSPCSLTDIKGESDLAYSRAEVTAANTYNSSSLGTFTEITGMALVAENDTAVVEFDGVTDRIEVKETGAYLVSFEAAVDSLDTVQNVYFAVFKNGTTEIASSRVENTFEHTSTIRNYANTFAVELTAGDKLSVYVTDDKDGVRVSTGSGGIALNVVRLTGSRGSKGDTGAGSSVSIEDSGIAIPNNPKDTLNFIGALSATDQGGGDVDIAVDDSAIDHNSLNNLTVGDPHTQYVLRNILTTKGDIFVRNATEIVRLPVGTNSQRLAADSSTSTGLVWDDPKGGIVGHYFPEEETTSSSWTRAGGLFIFPGSTAFGTPSEAKVVAWISQSGATGQVRLYDFTNAQVIGTTAAFSNTTEAIQTISTLSNIPTGEALFEWQFQRASGTGSRKVLTVGGIVGL